MKNFKLIFLCSIFVLFSCRSSIKEQKEYFHWINAQEHGLVKEKRVADLIIQVKYLPPDLLAWKELKGQSYTIRQRDSLVNAYSQSLNFLLTISPDSSKGANDDILYREVYNETDFKKKVNQMNFGIERMLKMISGNKEYYPAIAVMENTYGTSLSKKFHVVFSADDKTNIGKQNIPLDFVFADELFSTGINHFTFQNKSFQTIPAFDFRSNMNE